MNTLNPNTKNTAVRDRRIPRAVSDAPRPLLPVALAALALAAWMPRALACDIEVGSGSTVRLDGNFTVDCVKVAAGGWLIIEGGTLTLNGDGGPTTSIVDGHIVLESCTSVLKISDNNHTFEGNGYIDGQCDTAQIQIGSGLTLTNEVTVCGSLQIRAGSGTLDNDGLVEANDDGGTLTCYEGTFAGSGEYKVAWPGATLKFSSGIDDTGLAAAFTVGNATALLDIDEDVVSSKAAGLSFTAGTINVAPTKMFQIE